MAHNPIIGQKAVGKLDWGFKVEFNRVGVLFQNQRLVRMLNPGEGLSSNERFTLGEVMVYIIDTSPHALTWQESLPAYGNRDYFSVTINLNYRVSDPFKMVSDQVQDTETRLTRVLLPVLSKISRDFKLHDHIKLDAKIEETIRTADLQTLCGLALIDPPDVRVNLTDELQQRMKKSSDIERAMRVARSAEHIAEVPSKEPVYKFKVTANLIYRVVKPEELPSDSLDEAERQLWSVRMLPAIRRAGRKYEITRHSEADAAMQDALDEMLDEGGIEGFGLKVESAQLSTDLDEATYQRAAEIVSVEHAAKLEEAKRTSLKKGTEFYMELIQKGDWAVLAAAVSKGEISVTELSEKLGSQQREQLALKFKLIEEIRNKNQEDPKTEFEIYKVLMSDVMTNLVPPAPKPQLPESTSSAQGETEKP